MCQSVFVKSFRLPSGFGFAEFSSCQLLLQHVASQVVSSLRDLHVILDPHDGKTFGSLGRAIKLGTPEDGLGRNDSWN